jgi:hypothetical protein
MKPALDVDKSQVARWRFSRYYELISVDVFKEIW